MRGIPFYLFLLFFAAGSIHAGVEFPKESLHQWMTDLTQIFNREEERQKDDSDDDFLWDAPDWWVGGAKVRVTTDSFRWLYQWIMPQWSREAKNQDQSWKSFTVHLRDSYHFFPNPDVVYKKKTIYLPGTVNYIEGKITYVRVVPRSYRYDVIVDQNGKVLIEVRVHFRDLQKDDFSKLKKIFAEATHYWNESRIETQQDYEYLFYPVKKKKNAHFSVRLKDSTRGPYDVEWSRSWGKVAVAHEIGHMLGLGDEYKTISSEVDCLKASIMCASRTGRLMEHHHYFVLRRLFKESN